MLVVLKNENGEIKAVCEYYIVDSQGNFDRNGEFVWVNEVEISPQYRNNGILKSFIKVIIEKVPQAKFGYFHRQKKYPGRKVRLYHKVQWLKLLRGKDGTNI